MENISDVRKEENLLFILDSEKKTEIPKNGNRDSAVIVYLYYPDTVPRYIHYIDNIPYGIPAYIYSSNAAVLEQVKDKVHKKDIFFSLKENRGRDISALLVAAAEVVKKYEIICFVHDKRANAEYLKNDVELWIKNLWENTLSTEVYIDNVLKLFEENSDIGLLAPPEPYGEYFSHWYGDTWFEDYDMTVKLADRLELEADISKGKNVFTLGTVFWFRTRALKKLNQENWKYEDFEEEPLPIDGTLSHAIERIVGYVSQDAGYKVGTIMTSQYAGQLMIRAQEDMRIMFAEMKKRNQVFNMHQIINLDDREEKLGEFCGRYEQVYIYGAGNYGVNLLSFIRKHNWKIDGFVLGHGRRKDDIKDGLKVYELQELELSEKIGIIIGVSYEYREKIEEILKGCGFCNYIYGY